MIPDTSIFFIWPQKLSQRDELLETYGKTYERQNVRNKTCYFINERSVDRLHCQHIA